MDPGRRPVHVNSSYAQKLRTHQITNVSVTPTAKMRMPQTAAQTIDRCIMIHRIRMALLEYAPSTIILHKAWLLPSVPFTCFRAINPTWTVCLGDVDRAPEGQR